MRKELRFSGSGGQGVITAAIIFAEAAVAAGLEAAQSQSYGPEARGGASKAEAEELLDFTKELRTEVLQILAARFPELLPANP